MSAPMNDRLRATGEALDAMMTNEQALAYRPPPRAVRPAPQEPTFPPLEDFEDSQPPMGRTQKGKAAADEPVEDFDNHRNAPRPDPACLYGLVGEIAKAGSDTTEANPYAIAAAAIAYLGCAVGRGPYMPVGNTWHHPRLFMLHVGRSGEGRKGDAVSLTTSSAAMAVKADTAAPRGSPAMRLWSRASKRRSLREILVKMTSSALCISASSY